MRGRFRGGFSVLELMVSTVIVTLVMLIAFQLLAEAGQLLGRARVELAEPSIKLTVQWLRRDIQGASQLGSLAFLATSEPLELLGHEEGLLRYEKAGTNLDRVLVDAVGRELGRRAVLRGVTTWQWRALNPGLIEVEIVHQRRVYSLSTPGGGSPVDWHVMSESRMFALRGLPRRSW